jgi:hypothetical protein
MANAIGCERYVPTQMRFGKARERSFRGFITVKPRHFHAKSAPVQASLPELAQKPSFPAKDLEGNHYRPVMAEPGPKLSRATNQQQTGGIRA